MGATSPVTAVWQFLQYLFLFGLVLALAYFATRSLRRLAPGGKGRHLRLLDQLHLGASRSFYLLAVANRVVLVAMGEGGVAAVTTLDDPALVAELLQEPEAGSGDRLVQLAGGGTLPGVLTALIGSGAAALGQGAAALGKGVARFTLSRSLRRPDFEELLRSAQDSGHSGGDRLEQQLARLKKLVEKAEA